MSGDQDLSALLSELRPQIHPGTYVFTSTGTNVPAEVSPVATVAEDEGLTLVLPRGQADELGLTYDFVAAWITLRVHSALDAVGLTAVVATRLADAGIACNVIAGHHHDHLFVPADRADDAATALGAPISSPR